ncbi:family 4 glycosyl hydrolase [Paenibacillus arenilitoris]|uniref:Glycosyl hydrolase family 4 C-terminal domain-containing protein n=1 Tax=Paenibacillus arenilitoris TaxID=2772299 RepID=A0A927CM45_9BACL|nr:hypothetical protein [Paenibacillus arenilitoris]MBD2869108.1 hypothetical protein [Paenibacillus arenilitoris]
MKFVLIGGGSFVFAPTVLEDVIIKHRLMEGELVLVDPNAEAVEAMAGAGQRIAKIVGSAIRITSAVDRREVLAGADYVIVSASPQGARRWAMDFNILSELDMPNQARECGGLGGLMNALRSITLLLDVCRDMEELCPQAILLDVTNPMPRVVTAIDRYTSIRAAGFCNIAYLGPDGYAFLPGLVGKQAEEVEIVTAGLNHFAWVVSMKDRRTGKDLMPELVSFVREGDWSALPLNKQRELTVMRRWLKQYGAVAAGAVDHHAEYLPEQPDIHYATTPPYHGTEEERKLRLKALQDIASGESSDWQALFGHPSWEHPVDVALTLGTGASRTFDILNVRNNGAIPHLPAERIVEVTVHVENGQWNPIEIPAFPDNLASVIRQLSDVHEMIAEAAATGNVEFVHKAVDLDPAITNKIAAHIAVDRMLSVHSDLLPQFS